MYIVNTAKMMHSLTSVLLSVVTGESCTDPAITPSAYTTSDAVISSESVFIVELSLACANGAQVTNSPPPTLQTDSMMIY